MGENKGRVRVDSCESCIHQWVCKYREQGKVDCDYYKDELEELGHCEGKLEVISRYPRRPHNEA